MISTKRFTPHRRSIGIGSTCGRSWRCTVFRGSGSVGAWSVERQSVERRSVRAWSVSRRRIVLVADWAKPGGRGIESKAVTIADYTELAVNGHIHGIRAALA